MYLKSLELSGFKSFAKKSELVFNAPISSIVGPNGSGKSNLAEAFRFVLGEQSIKSLRGKKGEDLIFNGAGDAGRANRASVKVFFDNTKRFLNVDFDEVSIERVVHRDGINEYFINGSQVRLRDILELLASAHIGSSGYHIISQGEADRILSASIKERKTMIEDALGLRVYQYKKQESSRKLEKTEENIKQVESLRKEIAPHIKFLKKQVEKVEKTIEMKEKLKGMCSEYFKKEDEYLKWSRQEIEGKIKPLKNKLAHLEKELIEAKNTLSKSINKDKMSDEIVSLEKKIKEVRDNKNSSLLLLGRLEGQIASEERILQKQKEVETSESNKTVFLKDVEEVALNIDKKITEAESLSDISVLKNILRAVKEAIFDFISHNKKLTNDTLRKESEEEIKKLSSQKKTLEVDIENLTKTEEKLFIEYTNLEKEIEKEKDSNRDAEKAVFRIMSEQNITISELHALKSDEDKLLREEEDFKRELTETTVLVGREVLDFGKYEVKNETGKILTRQEIANLSRSEQEARRRAIEKIQIRIEDAGLGGSSADVLKEYKDVSDRDVFLAKELLDLAKSAEGLKQLILDLEEKISTEFKLGVLKINEQFQNFFSLMFGGGEAKLSVVKEKKRKRSEEEMVMLGEMVEMVEEEEEPEEGIDIYVNLPRKKIKGLVMLSGGERALTSIALLFAVSQVNPPPFIILDETDAALDEANSRKYGDMIVNLSKYSQLILITHNRETMSRAGIIYGVTMNSNGVSKLLSIAFDEAVEVAK